MLTCIYSQLKANTIFELYFKYLEKRLCIIESFKQHLKLNIIIHILEKETDPERYLKPAQRLE
jgi:hypothetical protein